MDGAMDSEALKPVKLSRKEKFSLYIILLGAMTVLGISVSLPGLSLIDFQINMNVTITQLSFGGSLGSIFSCIGSLAATIMLKKWNRQIQFGLFSVMFAWISMVFPLCTSYTLYLVASAAQGFLLAFLGTIPNVWVLEIFEQNSKTYLQLMHIFFPVGNTIGSLMAAPYTSKNTTDNGTIPIDTVDQPSSSAASLFATTEYSQLWIPYLAASMTRLFISFAIFGAYFIKPYRKPAKSESTKDVYMSLDKFEEAKKAIPRSYFWLFVTLISLVVGIELVNESNATAYFPTYLIKNNHLDSDTVAYCLAILSTATTVGRCVNIFLTMKIGIQTFLFINFGLMIAANLLITIAGPYSLYGIYAGIVLLGFGFSNSYPMMLALVEERITMSDRTMSLLNFTGAFFLVISPITVGYFLDSNPGNYMLLTIALTLVALAIYIVLVVLESRRMGSRFK